MFQKEGARIFVRNINRRIAEIRRENKLTQEDLAERMGVDVRDLQRWEKNKGMSLWTLYRFTVALQRPTSDFFQEPKKLIK
jgi:transcriptional regulator with XRE-family HTH domain